MKKKKRLQTLDRFYDLPGDDYTGDENLPVLADLVGAEIIRVNGGTVLKIVDDHDIFPYSNIKDLEAHLRPDIYRQWHFITGGNDSTYDPRRFVFFDTETTGLSGGTGVVVFLCGFGYFHEGIFRITQYFLPDYPHEPLFLEMVSRHLTPNTILVTYNGKAFDWPMLSQRFTINRMEIPEIGDHIDVLHPARSLFRRLADDCALITLEKHLLSFDRGEDIPGYLIPTKYFDYLYDRQPGMIPEIVRHNRLDVISLALVTRYVAEVISRPEVINSAELFEGTVNHYFRNRRFAALREFAAAVRPGYLSEISLVAQLKYSLALKSLGFLDEASRIWRLAHLHPDEPQVYRHLLELAKYQEHTEIDLPAAGETVELMMSLGLTAVQRSELLRRKRRLARKIGQKP